MAHAKLHNLLDDKDDDARLQVARRVGECLVLNDIPDAERHAAEALARDLVGDAIELVRQALSKAVSHAKFLPRDIALKIAHDVDAVACPFLEVTEVFSDADWRQLVLTISRGARVAVARRTSMSEGLALALTELGDTIVAEGLVDNSAAPMTPPVCAVLIDRFEDATWVLDKLAERDGLAADVAVTLVAKVSAAAREKLSRTHNLSDYTEPVVGEAESNAILRIIRQAPEAKLLALAEGLKVAEKLTPALLLMALRDGSLAFFEVGLSVIATAPLKQTRSAVRHGGIGPVTELFRNARFPTAMFDDFWDALQQLRSRAPNSA